MKSEFKYVVDNSEYVTIDKKKITKFVNDLGEINYAHWSTELDLDLNDYHLFQKNENGFETVSFLVKVKSNWTSLWQLLRYTIVVILLACLANYLFNVFVAFCCRG